MALQERDLFIPYKLNRHPANTSTEEFFANPEEGSNCQLLAVAFTIARGYEIDATFRSSEVFEDLQYTDAIFKEEDIQTGDILGLTTQTNTNPKRIHLGVAYRNPERGIFLVHNGREIGEATISPLKLLQKQQRYEKLACIKRPKWKLNENPYEGILEQLGYPFLV